MSSESDSDVFFDAEDNTPIRTVKSKSKEGKPEHTLTIVESGGKESGEKNIAGDIHLSVLKVNENDLKEAERKAKDNEKRRRKVEELRKQMLNDDDEILEVHSEQSSTTSSFEGIYPKGNLNLISKKTDSNSDEIHSVISLGKIGSILGDRDNMHITTKDTDAISSDSKYSASEELNTLSLLPKSKCLEPDVVASTKSEQYPVPPPRKKKNKKAQSSATSCPRPNDAGELQSPADPVESLAREFEYSLDLHSATRGQYVVKPQDREQDRAEGPKGDKLATLLLRSESLSSISSKSSQHTSDVTTESVKKSSEEIVAPYMVRTRSDSGRPLTDQEILAQVTVRNLDTGEQIPLSLAEEHLPKCLNPLSLHIMRLTSEYVSNTALDKERESDEESIDIRKPDSMDITRAWMRTRDLRRRLKMEVNKIMTAVDRVTHPRHGEEDGSEEEVLSDMRSSIKIKVSSKLKSIDKGSSEFDSICVVQELGGEHTGAVWTMKFSSCGRLLATAGQDHDLRIWVLKDAYKYFDDMRQKFNTEGKTSPTPSQDGSSQGCNKLEEADAVENKGPFMSKPFCRYKGHTAELLDVSWSKNYFILSSSMDKTVRLWHISRKECLCCFQHIDFVTAIAFHPRDDRYFLSGSLDGKLRLWNIPDKKVTLWNELDGQTKLITAVNFCQNGKIAVVGSYDGRCIFYTTEQLKYHTQIHVRSTKGKNAQGRKISGIEAMPGEDKILVTSNDSRIRLYDLRDLSLTCKYKGYVNLSSQIKASFSHDGKYIISGSENQFIYIWKTSHDCAKFRRDRNDYWTGIKAHNAVVTSAVFAPNPALILRQLDREDEGPSVSESNTNNCYVMVSADFSGIIKVFLHKTRNGVTNTS